MQPNYLLLSALLWLAWLVSWNLAAFWRHEPTVETPHRAFHAHFAVSMLGFLLVFWAVPALGPRLWPIGEALGWSMVALTAAGLAFTWWARIHMGKLWHGGIVRMEHHRVIDSGPFALVRHPIYTGMITALLAVAVIQARPQATLGVVLFALGFILTARLEERFLEGELPDYAAYRRRVPMIVPFVG